MDDLAAIRQGLLRLKSIVAAERFSRALYRHYLALKYDPNQPRDELGRWTDTGGANAELMRVSNPGSEPVEIQPVDVLMDQPPRGVAIEIVDVSALLSSLTDVQSSTVGLGVVGFLEGRKANLPDGFMVTGGAFGIVAPDANTNVIQGARVRVPDHITATVTKTPDGHVRVSFAQNL